MIQSSGRWCPSRISEASSNVGDPYTNHKRVEDEFVFLSQCIRLNMAKENLGSIGEERD